MVSRLGIAFLTRSKHLLISWLQSPSAVILEPPKIKSGTVYTVSPSISHEVMGPDAMIFIFRMLSFKPTLSLSSFAFIKRVCQEPAWGTLPRANVMRKEASAYAKVGSSLRKAPVPEHLPPKPESTYFTVSCSHLHLWLYGGAIPHRFSQRRSKLAALVNKNSWAWQGCLRSNLSVGRLACVTGLSILLPLHTWFFTTSQP